MEDLIFNPQPSTVMHLDLNSCFATIEQQANPLLRGKPLVVAAYTTARGCIIAPSIEAKKLGIKVGMRVGDGKNIYPGLLVLPPDPWKYRSVHLSLRKLLADYTPAVVPKSIDEFVLDLKDCPAFKSGLINIAREIKQRIRQEVGDWLTVSVGIAPNRFLAKLASSLHKPDGLDEINRHNFQDCYRNLNLTDLPYIKNHNAFRLAGLNIFSVGDFYAAPLWKLKAAFKSILGYYWYLRLRGYEIDNIEFGRRSYGNSYALPRFSASAYELGPILSKLTEKTGFRLRSAGYRARGIHLSLIYADWSVWHRGVSFPQAFADSRDIYQKAYRLLLLSPHGRLVRQMAVSVFGLSPQPSLQLDLFTDILKKESLSAAVDQISRRWGVYFLAPARMLKASNAVPDRIAFGGVKELEEFTLKN